MSIAFMFRVIYQHNKALCRASEGILLVGSSHNSRAFSAKLDCSSIANTRISSVGTIHIKRPNVMVVQIIYVAHNQHS